ncbi:MAG: hypothetical protein R6U37_00595 [Dehalococcoidia bacterium]
MIQHSGKETTRYIVQTENIEPDCYKEQSLGPKGWSETIMIGEKCYNRNPRQLDWHICQGHWKLSSLREELEGFNFLTDLRVLSDEEINGVDCRHYAGDFDSRAYYEQTNTEVGSGPYSNQDLNHKLEAPDYELKVDLWISKDNYFIQKIKARITYPDGNTEFSIKYLYDFGEELRIELPILE